MLATALSLVGAVEYWDAETTYQKQSADPYRIADQAARLEGLRASLPADAILGYFTDVPAEEALATSMFFAAQYALAPRLLQKGDSLDLVLGTLPSPPISPP
jgi:hypothetical protein